MGPSSNSVRSQAKEFLLRHERAFVLVSFLRRCAHLGTFARAQYRYRAISRKVRGAPRGPDVRTAVVLHLFYVEYWPRFLTVLEGLRRTTEFDLFVTLSLDNLGFAQVIHKSFPDAMAVAVPNLGRDVLPFMKIGPALLANGYWYVLKLHSKKSPHHPDGANWAESMVSNLVPADPARVARVLGTLSERGTGVIGAEGQYISLKVWLEGTELYLRRALRTLCGEPNAKLALDDLQYGFFAGSMFWARLDSFATIFRHNFSVLRYDTERGQTNATLPHAVERLFSLVPLLEGRVLYEVGPDGVRHVDVTAAALPWWSDVGSD